MVVDVPLAVSLFAVVPKRLPAELAFEMLSWADMALKLKTPPFVVALGMSPLEDVAYALNRPGGGGLDVSLLGDMPLKPEKLPTVDEGFAASNELLVDGDGVDTFFPKGVEFVSNRPLPADNGFDIPNRGPLLVGKLENLPVLAVRVSVVPFVASSKDEDNEFKLKDFEALVASAVLFDCSVFFWDPSVDDPKAPVVDGSMI